MSAAWLCLVFILAWAELAAAQQTLFLTGKVVDENGLAIEGAGVLAWDEWWINHYFTTTKPDGTFAIYSDYAFYHWMVSPTNYNMIRSDINPDTARMVNGTKTINLGELEFKKLDFKSLRYNL